MANDSEAMEWHLGHIVRNAKNKIIEWNIGDAIDTKKVEKHRECATLLRETFPDSPYAHLREKVTLFKETVANLWNPKADSAEIKQIVDSLPLMLDGTLSALRAYDDRTSHALSRRFGKNSHEVLNFKESLSSEYDNEFAYRFMYKLRNYSQHCGVPELSGGVRGYLSEGGEIHKDVSITFDSLKLVDRYDGWGKKVRQELLEIDGEFDAIETVNRMMLSCSRTYGKLLIARNHELADAAEYILSLDASPEGTEYVPALFGLRPTEWLNEDAESEKNWSLAFVRVDLALLLDIALKDASTVLNYPRISGQPPVLPNDG
ncbi:hypothetical protein [Streptomyces sp. NPDC088923]|uniref:hypothetical protein n=1 Tax=Streptomyces sp. NPDC088923 TaxID=3365913 RepID=UPI0037F648EF